MPKYKRLFSIDDIKSSYGYDLVAISTQGGFDTKEASCESWCDESAMSIHNLICNNRGTQFANSIYDFAVEEFNKGNTDIYDAIKEAQMTQMVFIIENGNKEASNKIDNTTLSISPYVFSILENVGILVRGF